MTHRYRLTLTRKSSTRLEVTPSPSSSEQGRELLSDSRSHGPSGAGPLMLLWLVFTLVACRATTHADVNVIFIVADDQRFDSIGAMGGSISTPNIDRLMDAGFAFPNIYNMGSSSAAVCAPSRAMFLTGRNLSAAWKTQNIDGVASIPSTFKAAGYSSFGTGKWHQSPTSFAQGFTEGDDIHFGGCIGCSRTSHHLNQHAKNQSFTASLSRLANGSVIGGISEDGIHVSERFGNGVVDFIAQQDSGTPYFAYIAFTAPHDPRSSPPAYEALYRDLAGLSTVALPANFSTTTPANRSAYHGSIRDEIILSTIGGHTQANVKEELADYYGMITHMDVQIGNIIDEAIRAEGLNPAVHGIADLTNTLLVFTSDHGLAIGSHGLMGKQNPFEHSIRAAPLTIAGSVGGIAIPHGSSNAFAYLTDIFPTLTDLAGLTTPSTVQGLSLGDIIRGSESSVRSAIYNAYKGLSRVIREGDWKLVYYPGLHKAQLFDLASDPHELNDLSLDPNKWSRMETMRGNLIQLESQLNAPGSGFVPAQFFAGPQVSWQPALSSTGTSDLSSGAVVLAWNGGGTSVTTGGIQFAASSLGSTATGALDGRSTGDVGYDQLLDSMTFGDEPSTSVALTGLIPGRRYRLQVWYTDLRAASDGRVMSYTGAGRVAVAGEASSPGPQSTSLTGNVAGDDPLASYGQYSVGTFVAVTASETLQLTANGFSNAHYNALLVQDVTADTGAEHGSGD